MYALVNQVCTLEQAKKFDELGLKLESYFVWVKKDNTLRIVSRERWRTKFWTERIYPAYSCAELGVLLPDSIIDEKYCSFMYKQEYMELIIGYEDVNVRSKPFCAFSSDRAAHAKADLLIHLLKEKIITSEDLSL